MILLWEIIWQDHQLKLILLLLRYRNGWWIHLRLPLQLPGRPTVSLLQHLRRSRWHPTSSSVRRLTTLFQRSTSRFLVTWLILLMKLRMGRWRMRPWGPPRTGWTPPANARTTSTLYMLSCRQGSTCLLTSWAPTVGVPSWQRTTRTPVASAIPLTASTKHQGSRPCYLQ